MTGADGSRTRISGARRQHELETREHEGGSKQQEAQETRYDRMSETGFVRTKFSKEKQTIRTQKCEARKLCCHRRHENIVRNQSCNMKILSLPVSVMKIIITIFNVHAHIGENREIRKFTEPVGLRRVDSQYYSLLIQSYTLLIN